MPVGDPITDTLAATLAHGAQGGFTLPGMEPDSPPVWLGQKKYSVKVRDDSARPFTPGYTPAMPGSTTDWSGQGGSAYYRTAKRKKEDITSLDEYLGSFLDMDSKGRDEWADYLISLGIINDDQRYDFDVLRGAWETAGQLASEMYARGQKVSPRDALKIYAGSDRGSGAAGAPGPFTGTRTFTSKAVDLTDPATAKAMVNSVLSQALGRAASEEDLQEFTGVLNSYERANPLSRTTTTEYVEDQAVSESSTTEGGVTAEGRQQVLMDEAMESEEFGAFQAASTYMNAFAQAIQSPV